VKREHILIIRFSAIGDVAMMVPVVYSLAKQYPDVRITVLSRGFARAFFDDLVPNVGFMEADIKGEYHGVRGLNTLYRRLVAKNFTAVADFHNVLRSSFLRMRFNLGDFRVEHIDKHRKGKRRLVASDNKQMVQQPTSFENYRDVLAKLGYPVKLEFHSIFPEEGGDLSQLPEAIGTKGDGEKWIGIAPFAAHTGKIYPLEKMKRVVEGLVKLYPKSRIFLFGKGAEENRVFSEWTALMPQCLYVSQHLNSMREELILMSRLDVMLSMDSGNMHLASLVGTRVVSVWGATHPYAGFLGWGQSTDDAIQLNMPCRPCSIFGNKPCQRGDYACLNDITPEYVIKKIERRLEQNYLK